MIRRIKKKPKKKSRFGKFLLKVIVFAVAVILLALSPLFNVKYIQVNGSKYYKNEDIITAAGIYEDQNGFGYVGSSLEKIITLRCGNAETAIIDACPYIGEARVKFQIPWKIVINVSERAPMAIVDSMGTYILIDSEGIALEAVDGIEGYNLPVVKGLSSKNFELGKKIETSNTDKVSLVAELLNNINKSDENDSLKLQDQIISIDVTDSDNVLVSLISGLNVNYGDLRNIKYRLSFTKQIYYKVLKKDEKGTLDFTSGPDPNFKLTKD